MTLPSDLYNNDAYLRWWEEKLTGYPANINELIVEVEEPNAPNEQEIEALFKLCRKTYVIWLNDPRIKDALEFLKSILTGATKYVFRLKLKPGSGLVGNNVLHGRTNFKDGKDQNPNRLLYEFTILIVLLILRFAAN